MKMYVDIFLGFEKWRETDYVLILMFMFIAFSHLEPELNEH